MAADATNWTFRVRIRLAPSSRLSIDAAEAALDLGQPLGSVMLRSWPKASSSLNKAEWIVMLGEASSEAEAEQAASRLVQALRRAFAKWRIAADFGSRSPEGRFTTHAKKLLVQGAGCPVLDDVHGIMVYPSEPKPRLACVLPPTLRLCIDNERLASAIRLASEAAGGLSENEVVAYDLFAASRFESTPDARLLSLVMALETLVVRAKRSEAAEGHVAELVNATQAAFRLDERERHSLASALGDLRLESISASGRRLVRVLGARTYGEQSPEDLWIEAYGLRGKLMHGAVPRPARDDVERCSAHLEVMVSDLLAGVPLSGDV